MTLAKFAGFLIFLSIFTLGFWLMIFVSAFVIPYWIIGNLKEARQLKKEAEKEAIKIENN